MGSVGLESAAQVIKGPVSSACLRGPGRPFFWHDSVSSEFFDQIPKFQNLRIQFNLACQAGVTVLQPESHSDHRMHPLILVAPAALIVLAAQKVYLLCLSHPCSSFAEILITLFRLLISSSFLVVLHAIQVIWIMFC